MHLLFFLNFLHLLLLFPLRLFFLLILHLLDLLISKRDHLLQRLLLILPRPVLLHLQAMREQLAAGLIEVRFVIIGAASSPSSLHEKFVGVWLHFILSEGPAVTGVVLVAVAAVRTNVVLVDLVEVD